jgi:DNA-binding response OmpR family regulator
MHLDSFRTTPSPSKQVLLVQPDDAERQSLMLPFQKFGYAVTEASNRLGALRIVESSSIDVVVADLELSEANELELPRQIRAKRDRALPSIVAVTAQPLTPQRILDAEIAGCDLVVEKPSHPWPFVVRIDQLVRRSRELRRLSSDALASSRRLSTDAARIRARAQQAIAHSHEAVSQANTIAIVGRVLTEFLNSPGITMTVKQAADVLNADAVSCETAFDALLGSGFLETTAAGYRRRNW